MLKAFKIHVGWNCCNSGYHKVIVVSHLPLISRMFEQISEQRKQIALSLPGVLKGLYLQPRTAKGNHCAPEATLASSNLCSSKLLEEIDQCSVIMLILPKKESK